MAGVLAGAAIAGVAIQAYGAISGASAQADAARFEADSKRQQADEILKREAINEQAISDTASRQSLEFGSASASQGGEGVSIGGQVQIQGYARKQLALAQRDAEFKAEQLRAGANIDTTLASDNMRAAWFGVGGTVLTTGAKAYGMFSGPSTASSLSSLPSGWA